MNIIKSKNVSLEPKRPMTPPQRIIKAADIAPDFDRRKTHGSWQFPAGQNRAFSY